MELDRTIFNFVALVFAIAPVKKKKKKSSLNIKKKGSQIEDYNPRAASQKVSELFCPLEEHSYIQIF